MYWSGDQKCLLVSKIRFVANCFQKFQAIPNFLSNEVSLGHYVIAVMDYLGIIPNFELALSTK